MVQRKPIYKLMLKGLGYVILGSVMCTILTLMIGMFFIKYILGIIVLQALCFGILGSMLYQMMWQEGDRDRNMVGRGLYPSDWGRGIKVGLVAMLPYYVYNVILTLSFCGVIGNTLVFFKLASGAFWPLIHLSAKTASLSDVSIIDLILFYLYPLFIPLICQVAYRLGFHGISIKEKLIFKNKDGGKTMR